MLGWTRILRTAAEPRESRTHALEVIERNAAAQMRLVDDLLDMARIISGKLRLDDRHASISREIAQAAIDVVRPLRPRRRSAVEVQIPDQLPVA